MRTAGRRRRPPGESFGNRIGIVGGLGRVRITVANQEQPGSGLGQLKAGAEFSNGLVGGRRSGLGPGKESRDNGVAENGLAEDDGWMRRAREIRVKLLRRCGIERKRSGGGLLRTMVAKKGIEAKSGGGGDNYGDELVAQ
jgi:hypothetical protein